MRRPRVKLDNLITVITVASKHSIDEAADELGLSASGVRRQLENIEEALGIRMFESGRGRLVLTEDHLLDFGVAPSITVDAYSAPEAIAYVEQKVGICLLAGTSIAGRTGIVAKPLSTNVLMRRSGVFIREDNHSPLLQKLFEMSLLRSDYLHLKTGRVSITVKVDSQKVKRIS